MEKSTGSKHMLICFLGVDGSGKTTNAKRLQKYMRSQGLPCDYVWNRLDHNILNPLFCLARLFALQGKNINQNYQSYMASKRRLIKHTGLRTIYVAFFFLGCLLQTHMRLAFARIHRRNIISDRYIHDLIVTLAVELEYDKRQIASLSQILRFFPKPDFTFLLDIPEKEAMKRKRDIPSFEFIRERRRAYKDLAEICGAIKLDGTASLLKLDNKIRRIIFREF